MNSKDAETPITSFTLSKLIAMSGGEKRPGPLGECIATSSAAQMEVFRFPGRLDAFVIGVGTEGETTFTSNLKEYRLKKDSLFIVGPKHILQIQSNNSFKAHVLVISPDFLRRINIDIKLLSRLFLSVEKQPCLRLCEAEWAGITGSFAEIRSESLPRPGDVYSPEVLRSMIRTLAYKVCRIIGRHIESQPAPETSARSRNDEYFNQFMSELTKHYMQERSVGFYAGQLHLTPKYLTTIIRKTSGRTAAEWIDDYVVLEAKNLLKYSTMSIQEIAYCLNFPNQSFFGKYFRSHTGMTPSAYRMSK